MQVESAISYKREAWNFSRANPVARPPKSIQLSETPRRSNRGKGRWTYSHARRLAKYSDGPHKGLNLASPCCESAHSGRRVHQFLLVRSVISFIQRLQIDRRSLFLLTRQSDVKVAALPFKQSTLSHVAKSRGTSVVTVNIDQS